MPTRISFHSIHVIFSTSRIYKKSAIQKVIPVVPYIALSGFNPDIRYLTPENKNSFATETLHQNNLKKVAAVRRRKRTTQKPRFHHNVTTIHQHLTTRFRQEIANPPAKTPFRQPAKKLQNIPRKILILHNRSHLLPHILRVHHNYLLHPIRRLPLNHRQRW